jgi:hypothetical protein
MATNHKDFQFFLEQAGYCVGHRAEGALQLARAEKWAEAQEMTFEWSHDMDPDLSWMSESEQAQDHEVLGCVLYDANRVHLRSLGGITDPSWEYRRVVEAELALEEMARFDPVALAEHYLVIAAA